MSDLETRIRNRLDEIAHHINACTSCTTCEASDPLHALRAVLDLHRPAECVNIRCPAGSWCVGCDPDGYCDCGAHPYPCPTIRAVADGLGVTREDGTDA